MTQDEQILDYLQTGKSITPLEALQKFGVFRLGARIFDLKAKGYNILSETVHDNRKHYAKYFLVDEPERTENEQAFADNHLAQEEKINTEFLVRGKQLAFIV